MVEYSQSVTSTSLLVRLRDVNDQEAWREFDQKYGDRIFLWCRARGLTDADSHDVTQNVLVRLVSALKKFQYDPAKGRFRGWLKQTTLFALSDFQRKRPSAGTLDCQQQIATVPDQNDFVEKLTEAMLLDEAESRVRPNVNEAHWRAYVMCKSGASRHDVAEVLGLSPGAVSTALYRIVGQLQQIISELDED